MISKIKIIIKEKPSLWKHIKNKKLQAPAPATVLTVSQSINQSIKLIWSHWRF